MVNIYLFMKKYCNFQIIFHNYYYFLGVNDCGDNSDEPANCQNDCSIALSAYAPEKICDANLDCIGEIKIFFISKAPVPLYSCGSM